MLRQSLLISTSVLQQCPQFTLERFLRSLKTVINCLFNSRSCVKVRNAFFDFLGPLEFLTISHVRKCRIALWIVDNQLFKSSIFSWFLRKSWGGVVLVKISRYSALVFIILILISSIIMIIIMTISWTKKPPDFGLRKPALKFTTSLISLEDRFCPDSVLLWLTNCCSQRLFFW